MKIKDQNKMLLKIKTFIANDNNEILENINKIDKNSKEAKQNFRSVA